MSARTRPRRGWVRWLRYLALATLATCAACVAFVSYANLAPVWLARGKLHDRVEDLPPGTPRVALLLGTTDQVGGSENLYFRYRIDAAEQLWKAGKLDVIIVSGDNRTHFYNEPNKMRSALIERGVPASRIVRDFAGLRTLDSVVRSREVFGAGEILVVSQRFHNERALYLARAHGIPARGFNARDVARRAGARTRLREVGARVKMWFDVHWLDTRPRHLGDPVELPAAVPSAPESARHER